MFYSVYTFDATDDFKFTTNSFCTNINLKYF